MGNGLTKGQSVRPETGLSHLDNDDENINEDTKSINEKAMEQHQSYLENMYVLKRMFKQLDPAVMRTTNDVQGEIKISVKYITEASNLLVKVMMAQDLMAKDARGHTSDSYVKIELLMDKKIVDQESDEDTAGMKCTSVAKNTRNPVFNEIFSFPVTNEQIEIVQLRCSVWCYDALGRDDFMGERIINVNELDCFNVAKTEWYELMPETDLAIDGKINVKLSYKLPQTLSVAITSAEDVNIDSGDVEPYVQVYIPGVPYVFKTWPDKDKTKNPVWNETFDFPVPKEELSTRYIVLVVGDANTENSYLGECHIDLDNFNCDYGFEGSFPLSDMRGNVAVRSRWTRNAVTQEFQEALVAHSMYKKPNFMFAKVRGSGNKAISVRIPKAAAQSRVRVVNGVLVH